MPEGASAKLRDLHEHVPPIEPGQEGYRQSGHAQGLPECFDQEQGYGCTLPRGHEGDHMAMGHQDRILASWPR